MMLRGLCWSIFRTSILPDLARTTERWWSGGFNVQRSTDTNGSAVNRESNFNGRRISIYFFYMYCLYFSSWDHDSSWDHEFPSAVRQHPDDVFSLIPLIGILMMIWGPSFFSHYAGDRTVSGCPRRCEFWKCSRVLIRELSLAVGVKQQALWQHDGHDHSLTSATAITLWMPLTRICLSNLRTRYSAISRWRAAGGFEAISSSSRWPTFSPSESAASCSAPWAPTSVPSRPESTWGIPSSEDGRSCFTGWKRMYSLLNHAPPPPAGLDLLTISLKLWLLREKSWLIHLNKLRRIRRNKVTTTKI